MQATISGNRKMVGDGIRFPDRSGENLNSEVKKYKLSPEELERYRTKPNEVALKQRNLTRWRKEKPYEACADLHRNWYPDEITRFIKMWNAGHCITKIAAEFKRDVDEVALLIIDRKRKGRIEDRPGGAYGRGLRDDT
jgi:hypothetical protein